MRYRTCAIGVVLLMLTGCSTTFTVVKPVYPKAGISTDSQLVDYQQPTFLWEPAAEPGVVYDLVIYEVVVAQTSQGAKKAVGEKVYYREGIEGTEHKIEDPLKPDMEYCWSIRMRKGDLVSEWSRYNQFAYFVAGYSVKSNAFFMFKTKKVEGGEEAAKEAKEKKEKKENEDPWAPNSLRLTNPPITK